MPLRPILAVLLLTSSSSFLVRRGSPYLHSTVYDTSAILQELSELQDVNDTVTIDGIVGNAAVTPIYEDGSFLFWWFVNKIGGDVFTDNVPVIMWLQGGPGCSSMTGNLWEFGPLMINETLQPITRSPTWAQNYHLLFVDSPFGAGYSFAANKSDYVTNEYQVAQNLYTLLQKLNGTHPEFFDGHDFYVFGESYAGKYVPAITYYILQWNQNVSVTHNAFIPLAGMGIGDGLTDPPNQFIHYSDYGFATGLLDEYDQAICEQFEIQAYEYIQTQQWLDSINMCNEAINEVVSTSGNVNMYNVRVFGDYNTTLMDTWLNFNSTKALLHVPQSVPFLDCGQAAYDALEGVMAQSWKWAFPYILNNTKVILYNGQDDLLVNTPGAEAWIESIPWTGQTEYLSAAKNIWYVNGSIAGYERSYGNLTQVVVLKAGHMVPHDQTQNSLDLVTRFIEGRPFS